MPTKPNTTWHARIDNERSICGLNPLHGQYQIATFCSFFTVPHEEQCERCLEQIERKGYNIDQLRTQYRAVYERAQQADLSAADHAMQPFLERARTIIQRHAYS